jgi:hypothetical protein
MNRDRNKTPNEAPKPRKQLVLKKKTVRDLEAQNHAHRIKGAGRSGVSG